MGQLPLEQKHCLGLCPVCVKAQFAGILAEIPRIGNPGHAVLQSILSLLIQKAALA
jgi:hypothetical protein